MTAAVVVVVAGAGVTAAVVVAVAVVVVAGAGVACVPSDAACEACFAVTQPVAKRPMAASIIRVRIAFPVFISEVLLKGGVCRKNRPLGRVC